MRPDDRTSDLIGRARAGDARAMEELLVAHADRLYAHVSRVLGHGPDAEDVVQDASVSAWRSIRSFEGTSFRAWLFRIATNRAIDVVRARRRRGELPFDPPDDDGEPQWTEPASPGPDLADLAADREAVGVVDEALRAIAPEQRAALLLRDVEGFDYAEIARITATEIGTVKSRIHRGRVAVRNALVARGWRSSGG
ncbi:MAG TPA: sigma-70 family RNA polymerase sigma factor [Candidatus Limnocylindria bacterium]|nr:sigma-70 family RNA polymerase sigma factor [Candidatus Limnocylindria bacterium]